MAKTKIFSKESDFWEAVCSSTQALNPASIALSGGSSAKIITALRADNFDFSNTSLWQTDERFVPQNHTDSNAKLLNDLLGNETEVEKFFFPVSGDPKTSAHLYEQELKNLNQETLFDLTVLGIGPDGHTASLFPGSDILNSENLAEATQTEVFAIKDRLTLTFKALEKSKKIMVLMMGASKREIFEKITNPETSETDFPARRLLDWDQVDILFLDA